METEQDLGDIQNSRKEVTPDALITEVAAASFLGLSVKFLQARRQRGGGPPFVRISQTCIRYRRRDLIVWTEDRLKTSTSAA